MVEVVESHTLTFSPATMSSFNSIKGTLYRRYFIDSD